MTLSYKTRRRLKTLGIVALSLVLGFILFFLIWLIWLSRYVVYSKDGATLNFDLPAQELSGEVALPPEAAETVPIFYNDGENAIDTSDDLPQLYGYYITSTDMMEDMDGVRAKVESLPVGTAVMLDVKSIYGYFFYSTKVGSTSDSVDIAAVDSLISYLKSKNLYMIARVPAFRDRAFGLDHISCGLPIEGGYLWEDDDGCYWLNPGVSGTINYLAQIVSELKNLGFREVVFTEFRFPDDMSEIVYDGSQADALNNAAATLVTSCASTTFAVSFSTPQGAITLPEGRTRQYLSNISAMTVQSTADQMGLEDPKTGLVFLTETNDTRFDEYSVLRPISIIQLAPPA